jgi:histidyl-tRNA synthetase
VAVLDPARWVEYLRLAEELRAAGVAAELYLDEHRLDRQLRYADRKGIPLVVIAGEDELAQGTVAIKDLRSGEQRGAIPRSEFVPAIRAALAAAPGGGGKQAPATEGGTRG